MGLGLGGSSHWALGWICRRVGFLRLSGDNGEDVCVSRNGFVIYCGNTDTQN